MSDALPCPETGSWQTMLDGALLPEQLEVYARHLEWCPVCQNHLDRAEPCGADLLRLAEQVGDPTAVPPDTALVQAVERLIETRGLERAVVGEPADLYFLRSTDKAGLLGTLGDYEVHEVIGQGGMGIVLKAFEPALHRHVAIKVLSPALAGSVTARLRFRREAQSASAVCHDHVVPVHGVSEIDGLPYLVMQYVAGQSLQARLDCTGPLEVTEIIRIGLQTASGLAAAHAQGLIHRDIKPANLLLEGEPGASTTGVRVKITDFGLARTADDSGLTQHGVVAGTPEYMAPEQARGETIDHRADLFSLGSVLYAMCTGTSPFTGSTTLSVLRQVSDCEPPPVRAVNPDIPAWLEALVARLLAKDPADRFQSATEVASLLEGYLAHLQQPAVFPAPPLPLTATANRPAVPPPADLFRRVSLGFRAAVLLLAAAGLGVGLLAFAFFAPDGGDVPQAPVNRLQGHTGPVHDVRFTRDGRLISASGWPKGDRTVRIWNPSTGQELGRIDLPGNIHSLALSPDERFALAGLYGGRVFYLDLDARQVVKSMKVHTKAADWIAFGRDENHFFTASTDGTSRMWDLPGDRELAVFRVRGGWARGGALFPDGRRLLTVDDTGLLQVWDITTRAEVKRIAPEQPAMIDSLTLTPNARHALVAGVPGVTVIDLETGESVRRFQAAHEEVYSAALSPDGTRLLTACFDGAVRLWDFHSGDLLQELGNHERLAFTVAFSPDGKMAASGGGGERIEGKWLPGTDHDIRLWRLPAYAPALKKPARNWLTAVSILLAVLAAITLGVVLWCLVRRSKRAEALAAPTPRKDDQDKRAAASPPIAVQCSACGKTLEAKADLAGKRVKCPQCSKPVLVPGIRTKTGNTPG